MKLRTEGGLTARRTSLNIFSRHLKVTQKGDRLGEPSVLARELFMRKSVALLVSRASAAGSFKVW
jgi:hypothetical protein